jgi:3-oxoacyl-[acyl-carrier protein] reductase
VSIDAELAGKRALVTGAGQGVGEAIARELAAAGCELVVNDFHADRADRVAAAITAEGGKAVAAAFDVTDHVAVATAVAGNQPLDILVNNAGNTGPDSFGTIADFVDTTPDQWEPFVAVNLYGVMNCVHAALPGMTERGWGRVITIVSDAARTGGAKLAAYSAAKAGAAGFSRAIAREVARHGVTVNTIALGTIRTTTTARLWDEAEHQARRDAMLADYLVRRPGEPDDVAWMVTMLASPRASWVTGQTIPVNGGFSLAL